MKFVFIGASGRSGTTLLQKMLLVHSQITGGPEFDHLYSLLCTYRNMVSPNYLERQSFFYNETDLKEAWKNFIAGLLTKNIDANKYTYFSEKTPNDILVSKELLNLFPDCKVIYVYRDGRDVVNSFVQVKKRAQERNEELRIKPVDFAINWNTVGKIYNELKDNPDYSNRVHAVRYEDMVLSPRKTITEVMNFLELPLEDKQIAPSDEDTKHIHVVDNVWYTKNMFTQNIGTQNVQKWKQELSLYQKIVFQTVMARQLKNFNYPVSSGYLALNSLFRNIYLKLKGVK